MTDNQIIKTAVKVFDTEIIALETVRDTLGGSFTQIIRLAHDCVGKVIITGMGKPGHIGRKIAATLSSLGTSSFFLHPADALHGDLGMVQEQDVVIAISYSGESEEITRILPNLKKIGAVLVAISGNSESTLVKASDYSFIFPAFEEACSMKLAPTSSTTAALVLGDAIAVCCSVLNNFKEHNYALYHPAGNLGKRLLLKTGDLMHLGEENSTVLTGTLLKDAIVEMSSKTLGVVAIVDTENNLKGVFTDGDLRRILTKKINVYEVVINDVMTTIPVCIKEDTLAIEALQIMTNRQFTVLIVTDDANKFKGIVKMSEIIKAGLVL